MGSGAIKRWAAARLLAMTALAMMALAMTALGKDLPKFLLTDTNGAAHTDAEFKGAELVLYFITTDCPISNGYVPEMNRIAKEFAARGVRFYGVMTDTTVPVADVRKHVKDFGYVFPVLLDPRQVLVRFTGADTNPEAAVIAPHGGMTYLGRIDNKVEGFGTQRPQATEHDLRDAIQATLAGRPAPKALTTPIGCSIVRVN